MKFLKGLLNILILSSMVLAMLIPVFVFVHEGIHYIMYTLEGIDVTSLHILDSSAFEKELSGYITSTKGSRYGIVFQEGIAYLLSCIFLVLILLFCLVKPLKPFTIRQLELMGVRRKVMIPQ